MSQKLDSIYRSRETSPLSICFSIYYSFNIFPRPLFMTFLSLLKHVFGAHLYEFTGFPLDTPTSYYPYPFSNLVYFHQDSSILRGRRNKDHSPVFLDRLLFEDRLQSTDKNK